MPRLSTGFVIVGAYADKVRRTLFAQMASYTRADKEWAQRVAYGAAQLNRLLYEILVNRLKLDKGDVVRVRIDYDVDEQRKEVVWKWNTLTVEAFRRMSAADVEGAVKDAASRAQELLAGAVRYEVVKLGETEDGDVVYSVRLGGSEIGAVEVTPLNDEVLLKAGAVLEPSPAVFQRSRVQLRGRSVEEAIAEVVSRPLGGSARQVGSDEALKVINMLRSRVSAKPFEAAGEEEEEEGGEG